MALDEGEALEGSAVVVEKYEEGTGGLGEAAVEGEAGVVVDPTEDALVAVDAGEERVLRVGEVDREAGGDDELDEAGRCEHRAVGIMSGEQGVGEVPTGVRAQAGEALEGPRGAASVVIGGVGAEGAAAGQALALAREVVEGQPVTTGGGGDVSAPLGVIGAARGAGEVDEQGDLCLGLGREGHEGRPREAAARLDALGLDVHGERPSQVQGGLNEEGRGEQQEGRGSGDQASQPGWGEQTAQLGACRAGTLQPRGQQEGKVDGVDQHAVGAEAAHDGGGVPGEGDDEHQAEPGEKDQQGTGHGGVLVGVLEHEYGQKQAAKVESGRRDGDRDTPHGGPWAGEDAVAVEPRAKLTGREKGLVAGDGGAELHDRQEDPEDRAQKAKHGSEHGTCDFGQVVAVVGDVPHRGDAITHADAEPAIAWQAAGRPSLR